MSWQNDRADAIWYADYLSIPETNLTDLHAGGDWTWAQIADQLQKQYDAHEAWVNYGGTMEDLYPEDHDDVPDWMGWYHA